jgi:hypothetical protein
MHIAYFTFILIVLFCTNKLSLASTLKSPAVLSRSIKRSLKFTANKISTHPRHKLLKIMSNTRGGAEEITSQNDISTVDSKPVRNTAWRNILGLWGIVQVISVMANAIKRLYPIAVQPFYQKDLLPYEWAILAGWSLYMGYAEGYKAFQLKFAPMVVHRAFELHENPSVLNFVLAGPYSMGMFAASRKRMIVSWSIMAGVFSLVKLVKMLPYPYRAIVDCGVVVGLSYGTLAIVALAIKALFGGIVKSPDDDVAVEAKTK